MWDDSEQHRSAIAGEVSKLGYDVGHSSGARALQLVNTEEYDLVLLDVVMPGLDGFGTLDKSERNLSNKNFRHHVNRARAADDVIQAASTWSE